MNRRRVLRYAVCVLCAQSPASFFKRELTSMFGGKNTDLHLAPSLIAGLADAFADGRLQLLVAVIERISTLPSLLRARWARPLVPVLLDTAVQLKLRLGLSDAKYEHVLRPLFAVVSQYVGMPILPAVQAVSLRLRTLLSADQTGQFRVLPAGVAGRRISVRSTLEAHLANPQIGPAVRRNPRGGIDLIITIDACVGPGGKSYTIGGERLHLPGACGRACVCVLPLLSEPASPFLRRSLSQSHRAGPPIVQDKCNRWTASMRR